MNKPEALISLAAEITKAIESFTEQDSSGKQVLTQLASSDPASFFAAAIGVLATAKPSVGSRYLILSLAKDKRLGIGLLDPNVCTVPEAVAVTRAAAEAGAQLQSAFEMTLNKTLQGQSSPQKSERILRVMDILSVTCGQNCWNSFQVELMAYPDKVVRSKAALLIGKSTRNVAWIARRLLDRDPRVQASAVEALWEMDPEETKPHLLSALKSKNNRVAANAALGLYLCGDATAMRMLLEMLRHPDPMFRLSALWAIGETQDERFLPVLTEHYKHAEGKLRLATVGAMSRIRRREKTAHETSALQVHISQAAAQADGLRRLSFALSCHPARDLRAVKPGEFAVWENGVLIEEYQARLMPSPALLMVGFIVPWSESGVASGVESAVEPAQSSTREALKQCLSMKRRDDLWRIDRYSLEPNPSKEEKSALSAFPYDESLATPELKASHGCISDPDLLAKALSLATPAQCAAPNPLIALQRQCEAFGKRSAKRHVFLLLHDVSGFDWKDDASIARLRTMAQESSVVLHGICPDLAGEWAPFRELCLSNPDGSFAFTKLDGMVDALVDAYANLCSRFEISYSLPASVEAGPVKLKISSGFGQADIAVDVAMPPPPPEPVAAAAPAVPSPPPVPVA
jgi:HEAT repeat protein